MHCTDLFVVNVWFNAANADHVGQENSNSMCEFLLGSVPHLYPSGQTQVYPLTASMH